MTTVGQAIEWLKQLDHGWPIYAYEGIDCGIVVVADESVRFLHAAETDPAVIAAQNALTRRRR